MTLSKSIFFVLVIVCASNVVRAVNGSKCECGVFKFPTPETTKKTPIISKAPEFNFECSASGKESCSNMCKALAGASKEQGPKTLCGLIQNSATPVVPLVYYKACDDDKWTFTGLKSTLSICCKEKAVIPCA